MLNAELFAIAVALSMDALAVAVTTGVTLKHPSPVQFVRLPLAFGAFQCLMPLLGWCLGHGVRHHIEAWDHWISFALLVFVGGKLLWESLTHDEKDDRQVDPTRGWTIVLLAIATSIDALAVGFSFALLARPIVLPSIIIGLVCAGISLAGMVVGARIGRVERVRRWSGVAGACALFLIALLILAEHGVF